MSVTRHELVQQAAGWLSVAVDTGAVELGRAVEIAAELVAAWPKVRVLRQVDEVRVAGTTVPDASRPRPATRGIGPWSTTETGERRVEVPTDLYFAAYTVAREWAGSDVEDAELVQAGALRDALDVLARVTPAAGP